MGFNKPEKKRKTIVQWYLLNPEEFFMPSGLQTDFFEEM